MNQSYKIVLSKNALNFINKQGGQQRKRILSAVYRLPNGDVKKLKGVKYYRLRIGDVRVLFVKDDKKLMIIVIDIGNRGQVYNNI